MKGEGPSARVRREQIAEIRVAGGGAGDGAQVSSPGNVRWVTPMGEGERVSERDPSMKGGHPTAPMGFMAQDPVGLRPARREGLPASFAPITEPMLTSVPAALVSRARVPTSADRNQATRDDSDEGRCCRERFREARPAILKRSLTHPDPNNLSDFWCPGAESNHRHGDFQSPALPTELPGQGLAGASVCRARTGQSRSKGGAVLPGLEGAHCLAAAPGFLEPVDGRRRRSHQHERADDRHTRSEVLCTVGA